jgi:hypothetical protein
MLYVRLFFLVIFFQSAVPHIANATTMYLPEQIDFLQETLRSTQTLLEECRFRDQSVQPSLQAQALNDLIDQLRRIPENQELFDVFDRVQSLDLDHMSPEELCGGGEDGPVPPVTVSRTDWHVGRFNSCMEQWGDRGIRYCMGMASCVPVGMSYQEWYPERVARYQEMEERMREHMPPDMREHMEEREREEREEREREETAEEDDDGDRVTWADQAFQLRGSQEDYDRVMEADDPEEEFHAIEQGDGVAELRDRKAWADRAFQLRGSQDDYDRVMEADDPEDEFHAIDESGEEMEERAREESGGGQEGETEQIPDTETPTDAGP